MRGSGPKRLRLPQESNRVGAASEVDVDPGDRQWYKNRVNASIFLERVVVRNYKSIAACSVRLRPLVFLVGQNGSGKSNFLDALQFVREALHTSLDHALRERGGINEVRRRSLGHPTHFGVRLDFRLPDATSGHYAFRVGAKARGGFEVQEEECYIYSFPGEHFYRAAEGRVLESSAGQLPPGLDDRLFLVVAASLPEYRLLFDCLTRMGFYSLRPEAIRDLQLPDAGEVLRQDGSNLASVLGVLGQRDPAAKARVVELLSKVVPGIVDVTVRHVGKRETLEFHQQAGEHEPPWRFTAENMSDGTLRAVGVLTALFQSTNGKRPKRVSLVGIEDAEIGLHPAAAVVLREALKTVSEQTQVLVTNPGPEVLDDPSILDESILGVTLRQGETLIGAPADRLGLRDALWAAGERLRENPLNPNLGEIDQIPASQLELFGKAG